MCIISPLRDFTDNLNVYKYFYAYLEYETLIVSGPCLTSMSKGLGLGIGEIRPMAEVWRLCLRN